MAVQNPSPAPGEDPFRAKGTIWIGMRTYAEQSGAFQRLPEVLEPRLVEFVNQMFVPLGWYDALPLPTILRALASLSGQSFSDYVRVQSIASAQRDMRGIYKVMLKLTSPEAVCKRFGSIFSQLYNFGGVKILNAQSNEVDSEVHGMPEPLADWWMKATDAYLPVILGAAGAKNIKLTWKSQVPDGSAHGVRLIRIYGRTSWK